MNPDIKTKVKLPTFNWDKILVRSAIAMGVVTGIALISRARGAIIAAEVIDVGVILMLLSLGTYAIIARSIKSDDTSDKS